MPMLMLLLAACFLGIAFRAGSDTGILRSKRDGRELLESLAQGINAYFETHGGETHHLATFFYAICGLFMIASSVSLFLLRLGH